ncbi:gamma-interferon-responsive lysosomal thiol protein-like [Diospyros lotus]|uniref:gamma-interferon-responsive lysosomal thiol protein-like n=1 Tax=Diospyros lotus TaxID=55363 RepID=UPI0022590137|nr:gamma-interferon-responsive lysosomal thiol protein-like [Diospyros lotus]
MISHKAVSVLLATFVLVVFFISQSQSHASDDAKFRAESGSDSQKVNLSLYYETLCPYCANFIVNSLAKIFENGLISIINLRLVPWGNTFLKDNNTWVCQHGPDECVLNTVEACAIKVWPDLGAHFSFRFVECVERLHLQNKHGEWESCFRSEGLNSKPLVDCYNSGLGFQLERSYADETAGLTPPHRFVPWVVVNNQPLQDDYQNFLSYVCRAYKGPRVPKVCSSHQDMINSAHEENSIGQGCYASEAKRQQSKPPTQKESESPTAS